ncbi:MAG: hypothetical protein H6Q70_3421 [Firmicutes bacterium]|nr:hypothetical protein [Bacillota bacterium]
MTENYIFEYNNLIKQNILNTELAEQVVYHGGLYFEKADRLGISILSSGGFLSFSCRDFLVCKDRMSEQIVREKGGKKLKLVPDIKSCSYYLDTYCLTRI